MNGGGSISPGPYGSQNQPNMSSSSQQQMGGYGSMQQPMNPWDMMYGARFGGFGGYRINPYMANPYIPQQWSNPYWQPPTPPTPVSPYQPGSNTDPSTMFYSPIARAAYEAAMGKKPEEQPQPNPTSGYADGGQVATY